MSDNYAACATLLSTWTHEHAFVSYDVLLHSFLKSAFIDCLHTRLEVKPRS